VTPNLDELFKILEANWDLRFQKYELRGRVDRNSEF
jgi:hypothetical protein